MSLNFGNLLQIKFNNMENLKITNDIDEYDIDNTSYLYSIECKQFFKKFTRGIPDEKLGDGIEYVNSLVSYFENFSEKNITIFEEAIEVKVFTKAIFNIYSRLEKWDGSEEFTVKRILKLAVKLNLILTKACVKFTYDSTINNPQRLLTHSYFHLVTISRWLFEISETDEEVAAIFEKLVKYFGEASKIAKKFNDQVDLFKILHIDIINLEIKLREDLCKDTISKRYVLKLYLYVYWVEKIFEILKNKEDRIKFASKTNGNLYNKNNAYLDNEKYGYNLITLYLLEVLERCAKISFENFSKSELVLDRRDVDEKNFLNMRFLLYSIRIAIGQYYETFIVLIANPEIIKLQIHDVEQMYSNLSTLVEKYYFYYKSIENIHLYERSLNSDIRGVLDFKMKLLKIENQIEFDDEIKDILNKVLQITDSFYKNLNNLLPNNKSKKK